MRGTGLRIDHQVGISMVGCHDPLSTPDLKGLLDSSQAAIHGLASPNGGFDDACVTNHIAIGEVHHDEFERAAVDAANDFIADTRGTHLGLQIVGCHLGRWHHLPLLPGIGPFATTIEEIGDVRVFLCFRHAQVVPALVLADLAENAIRKLRLEDHVVGVILLVTGHRYELKFPRQADTTDAL